MGKRKGKRKRREREARREEEDCRGWRASQLFGDLSRLGGKRTPKEQWEGTRREERGNMRAGKGEDTNPQSDEASDYIALVLMHK